MVFEFPRRKYKHMKNIKNISKIVLVNLSILLLLIMIPEGAVRLLWPAKEAKAIFNDKELRVRNRPFVEHHPNRGFSLKPGFRNDLYHVNSDGFRGEELPNKGSKAPIVLSMGESTTFGWLVDDNGTYPRYLKKDMESRYPEIAVVNGGVPSYTSSQVRIYLDEILKEKVLRPDMVLINIMWNDIWYSTVENWHEDILVYQKPPDWIIWLNKHSRLFTLIIERLSPPQEKKINRFNAQALAYYTKNLESMVQSCREHDIAIAFIEPPLDADHVDEQGLNEFHIRYTKPYLIETARSYRKAMREVAKKLDIPIITHRLDIDTLHQKPLFLDALHPTAHGNKMMAEDIAGQLILLIDTNRSVLAIQ